MSYNLRRLSDKAGDSGFESFAIAWNEDGSFKEIVGDAPVLGCSMRVGSHIARTYQHQDYWMTTPIIEILEEKKSDLGHYVKFRTKNSYYEWWVGEYPHT